MRAFKQLLLAGVLIVLHVSGSRASASERWTESASWDWYHKQGTLIGANFLPANASNQLEMWQAETFDRKEIDKELSWADSMGMNTMRVFLHDLVWQVDRDGFKSRIEEFLAIAAKHKIKPMLVLFDSCWDPNPKLGRQPAPVPGIHNSRWVQSPGRAALTDEKEYPRLQGYVKDLISAFAQDERVLAWDLWNEPNNTNGGSYGNQEPPGKLEFVEKLLPEVFTWARAAHPSQPLTSGVWDGDWSSQTALSQIQKTQIRESDIITFHNYGWPEDFEHRVQCLEAFKRPLICTEYMARPIGSVFDLILPIAQKHNVGLINWGFVEGKSQTYMPWDSWKRPYVDEPVPVWFHDIFYSDGRPYRPAEIQIIRSYTASNKNSRSK